MKRVCHSTLKGTPLMWRRPPFNECMWLSKDSREPLEALMPPSVLQPLTWLAHSRASQPPRSQVRGGAYPEQSRSTSEARSVRLLCRDWWVTEPAKFLHIVNTRVQAPSVFLAATHIPSFSCPLNVSVTSCADRQPRWCRPWRAEASTPGVCVCMKVSQIPFSCP